LIFIFIFIISQLLLKKDVQFIHIELLLVFYKFNM